MTQKKIAFAQSDHVQAVIVLLQECGGVENLVGDTEYATVVNAVTLDANKEMLKRFIENVDRIKKGGLHNTN